MLNFTIGDLIILKRNSLKLKEYPNDPTFRIIGFEGVSIRCSYKDSYNRSVIAFFEAEDIEIWDNFSSSASGEF